MKIKDLNKEYQILTTFDNDTEINNLYCGDLLSFVVSHAKPGDFLLTITNNMNTIAVGVLVELAGIIFCEGVLPTQEMINKANDENIVIITTLKTKVEVIKELG